MDEELALQLSESDKPRKLTQEEEDFQLALKLSQQPQEEPLADTFDDDYLFALQLQTELDVERDEKLLYLEQQRGNSKVHVSYANCFRSNPSYLPAKLPEPAEDDDYDQYYDDYYPPISSQKSPAKPKGRVSAAEFQANQSPSKATPSPVKTTQTNTKSVDSATVQVTKHDPEICGRKNTSVLESQFGIDCGNLVDYDIKLDNPVYNQLSQHAVETESRRIRKHGKEDRETRENVMDQETRLLVFKMINEGILKELSGIISSGKEANVYRGYAPNSDFLAVKIYKTTLNEFKNREDYIKYDFRFRYRCNNLNSKKFIKVWAEKEVQNLHRLRRAGIPCPTVISNRKHIIVMNCIGNSTPAPQLKCVSLSQEKFSELYVECLKNMRLLFQQANLVHSDLSEYNILYDRGQIYFIDVAQAVEFEHPFALEFLRRDCAVINKFFLKKGVPVLTTRELFEYITDKNINDSNEQLYLDRILDIAAERGEPSSEDVINDEVFIKSFIPRYLGDISDPLEEAKQIADGNLTDVFHQSLTGFKPDMSGISVAPALIEDLLPEEPVEILASEEPPSPNVAQEREPDNVISKDEQRKARKEAKKVAKAKQRETRRIKKANQNQ